MPRCCWPGWTRRSAAPSPPTRTRCASWPAPGRARPGSSPAASPTGRRPATLDPRHVLALTFTRKAAGRAAPPGSPRSGCGTGRPPARSTRSRWPSSRAGPGPRAGRRPVLLDRKARLVARILGRTSRMTVPELGVRDRVGEGAPGRPRRATHGPPRSPTGAPACPATGSASLYRRYEDEKRQRRVVDFDDLLADCARAMERRPDLRRRPAVALPAPVRRRVPGRQPAPAPPADALARRPGRTCASSATRTRRSTAGTAPTPRTSATSRPTPRRPGRRARRQLPIVARDPRRGRGGARRASGAARSPRTGPSGPVPTVVTYPTDTDEAARHRPSGPRPPPPDRSVGPPGRARAHQRADRTSSRRPSGRARIPYRLRGAAPFLDPPGRRRGARRPSPEPPAVWPSPSPSWRPRRRGATT